MVYATYHKINKTSFYKAEKEKPKQKGIKEQNRYSYAQKQSKLQSIGQIQSTACFCKYVCWNIAIFIHFICLGLFSYYNSRVELFQETICPHKANIITTLSFYKKSLQIPALGENSTRIKQWTGI